MSANYPLGIQVDDAVREVLGITLSEAFPRLEYWSCGRSAMTPSRVIVRWKGFDGQMGIGIIDNIGDDPLSGEDMRLLVASVLALLREGTKDEH